jgi:hypothetical protein
MVTSPFLGGIGNWFTGQDQAGQGLYAPEDYQRARADLLMSLGTSLMAAGQPMTGAQRAQIISGMGQIGPQYQQDLRAGLANRREDEQYAQQKAFDQYASNPENLKKLGWNDSQIALVGQLPSATRNKVVQDELTSQFSSQAHAMGLQLQYWTDADGKLHAGQMDPNGGVREVQIPGGGNWAPPMQTWDTPGAVYRGPSRGRGQPDVYQKDYTDPERQKEAGALRAKAQNAWPSVEANSANLMQSIDTLAAHPGLPKIVGGVYETMVPNMPGGEAADAQAKLKETTGRMFAAAYDSLRNAGAISDQEGKAATQAVANLEQAQGLPQFQQALMDLKDWVRRNTEVARQKAYGDLSQSPVQTDPSQTDPSQQNGGWIQRGDVKIRQVQ